MARKPEGRREEQERPEDFLADLPAERLGAAFEGAPIGMVIKNAEGTLLRSNTSFRRMLGYEEEEIRGMSRRDFTHPEDAEKDAELYSELLRGGREGGRESFQIEKRYVKKGGGVMWGRLSVSRLRGDEGEPKRPSGLPRVAFGRWWSSRRSPSTSLLQTVAP